MTIFRDRNGCLVLIAYRMIMWSVFEITTDDRIGEGKEIEMITASMQHTPETIQRLSFMQYQNFGFAQKIFLALLSCLLVITGIREWSQLPVLSILCLFAGCWMFSSFKVYPMYRAKKICQSFHDNYPFTRYEFRKDHFTFYGDSGKEIVPYARLIRLVEDSSYLYLYISRQSAFMIDLQTLRPEENTMSSEKQQKSEITLQNVLKKRIAEGSGLGWTRPHTRTSLSLLSILQDYRVSRTGSIFNKAVKHFMNQLHYKWFDTGIVRQICRSCLGSDMYKGDEGCLFFHALQTWPICRKANSTLFMIH